MRRQEQSEVVHERGTAQGEMREADMQAARRPSREINFTTHERAREAIARGRNEQRESLEMHTSLELLYA